ncbi:MAG TPA: Nif11 family protein [Prochlorococcus sp.]
MSGKQLKAFIAKLPADTSLQEQLEAAADVQLDQKSHSPCKSKAFYFLAARHKMTRQLPGEFMYI